MIINLDWPSYNGNRYSKPWIAKVQFSEDGTASFDWGNYVGDSTGGMLVLTNVEDDQIVAYGQKDVYGKKTRVIYKIVKNGMLSAEITKTEAFKLQMEKIT